MTRSIRIIDEEHIKEELDHLLNVFKKNGYDDRKIKKSIEKEKQGGGLLQDKKKEALNSSFLTFREQQTKHAKILRKENINVTFSPHNTIGRMMDLTKD